MHFCACMIVTIVLPFETEVDLLLQRPHFDIEVEVESRVLQKKKEKSPSCHFFKLYLKMWTQKCVVVAVCWCVVFR